MHVCAHTCRPLQNFGGTVTGEEHQYLHRRATLPGGTEVDMMGVDRLLQSMNGGGDGSFRSYYTRTMAYTAYMCI